MSSSESGNDRRRRRVAALALTPFLSDQARSEILAMLEDLRSVRSSSGRPLQAKFRYWLDLLGFLWTALISRVDLEPEAMSLRPWRTPGNQEGFLRSVAWDARYGFRSLRSTPLLSLAALLTIGLAIGANTAIFSFADALLFRPLPVPEPDRVVSVYHQSTINPDRYSAVSVPDFEEFRAEARAYVDLAVYSPILVVLKAGERTTVADAMIVSGNYFSVLGSKLPLGRSFLPEEDRTPGSHPVAIISHSFWMSHFGGDASAIGSRITLNDSPFTIIGVAPREAPAPGLFSPPQVWVPLMMHQTVLPAMEVEGESRFRNRGMHWLLALGRLREGVDIESAENVLRTVARRQSRDYPETNNDWTIAVVPAEKTRAGPPSNRAPIQVAGLLGGVVGLVLLIACANVANLLLSRAEIRRREMAIRMSLGAGRSRLFRQLLIESLLLSLTGGVVGVLLAVGSAGFLMQFWSAIGPGAPLVKLDARVLTFALLLSVLTGLIFGAGPALRTSLVGVVRGGGRDGAWTLGKARIRTKKALVGLQVAFSILLLAGAGLMLRTLWNLQTMPLGFDVKGVQVVIMEPVPGSWTEETERGIQEEVVRTLRNMPGVQTASLAYVTPLGGGRMADDILWESPGQGDDRSRMNVDMNVVDAGFFQALGIEILRGRGFSLRDGPRTQRVVVVNEVMAERLWPGLNPLGRHIWLGNEEESGEPMTVVGVVGNGRYHRAWRSPERPFAFLPLSQNFRSDMCAVLRTEPGAGPRYEEILHRLEQVSAKLPPPRISSLEDGLANSVARERATAVLLVLFGCLALSMAAVGIYGVASFAVNTRRHELGVRIALGARRNELGLRVVLENLAPVIAGAAGGCLAALALGRFVRGLLYGVDPGDPVVLGVVAITLSLVGLFASLIPAQRAMRLDATEIMTADG